MKYDDEIRVKRPTWRGVTYDSQLEADWASTLTMWGMDFVYHPGRVYLSGGDVWEPDFQLEDDMVLEVKGAHNHRIEKVWKASVETELKIVVGRAGWIPAGSSIEVAGAVWEPEEWVVVNDGSRMRWLREDDVVNGTVAHYSATYAYARGLEGIRMFKAVGESDIK